MTTQQTQPFVENPPPPLLPSDTLENRLSNWSTMRTYIDTIGDRLGMGIDEGVKDTIVALNLNGIETSQSCEGHLDRAIAAPWIDISVKQTSELTILHSQADLALNRAEQRELEGADEKELDSLYSEYHRLSKEAGKAQIELVKKASALLSEFYAERKVTYDQMLVIQLQGRGGRIQPNGTPVQEIRDEAERTENLRLYQQEMAQFTEFLKKKYLGN